MSLRKRLTRLIDAILGRQLISINKRSPEIGQEVLVLAISRETGEIVYDITGKSDRYTWVCNLPPEFEITHWMELPRVPNGEWRVRDYRKEY